MTKFKANKMELMKTPHNCHLLWVVIQDGLPTKSATTYQTLALLDRTVPYSMLVVDIKTGRTEFLEVDNSNFDELLGHWRDNYFNPDWFPELYVSM
jgi:hypothetical protein